MLYKSSRRQVRRNGEQIVEKQPQTRFERSHLLGVEPTGLRVETVYYVLNPDYNLYADIQHTIYLELLRRLQREQIQLGYSTRTVQLQAATP